MTVPLALKHLRPLPTAAAIILGLHLLAALAWPADPAVTFAGVLFCNAAAFYACILRSRGASGILSAQWRLLSLFLCFNYVAALLLRLNIHTIGVAGFGLGVHEFAALLRGLPLLLALILPERGSHPTQDSDLSLWLASIQALLFAGLAWYALFFIHPFGRIEILPGTLFPTTGNFLAEYAILATAFTIRLVARSSPLWTSFYLAITFLLWACLGLGVVLHAMPAQATSGSVRYVAFDVVILAFALYGGRPAPSLLVSRSGAATLYLNIVGPAVFPLVIFLVAVDVARVDFSAGIAAMGLSLLLFALRTASLQTGYRRMKEQMLEDNQLTALEARIDQLTGIPNRRSFDRTLDREWRRAERTRQPIGLLMVDVDKFKHLNDTQGHPAGDRTLKRIASILDARLHRATDFVARYGGEEFAVILTDTSPSDIKAIAESLRAAVAEARLPNATDIGPCVSISIGAALTRPAPPLVPSSLLSGADQALYRAKRNGRNRVEFADLLDAPSPRAQTDGALRALISDYKESVYGGEADPTIRHSKVRGKFDRRASKSESESESTSGVLDLKA
jgi:diguanylate cyclase (GGDEF)-like protein